MQTPQSAAGWDFDGLACSYLPTTPRSPSGHPLMASCHPLAIDGHHVTLWPVANQLPASTTRPVKRDEARVDATTWEPSDFTFTFSFLSLTDHRWLLALRGNHSHRWTHSHASRPQLLTHKYAWNIEKQVETDHAHQIKCWESILTTDYSDQSSFTRLWLQFQRQLSAPCWWQFKSILSSNAHSSGQHNKMTPIPVFTE